MLRQLVIRLFGQRNKLNVAISIAIFSITFLVFLPSISSQFLFWDDNHDLVFNPYLLNSKSFSGLFKYLTSTDSVWFLRFIPLSRLSYFFNYISSGMAPSSFHLMNIFIHSLNSSLLFIIFSSLKKENKQLLLSELIFIGFIVLFWATNPLRVESVSWVTARPHLLAFLFLSLMFLTLISYKQSKKKIIIAFFLYFCSLLSNPTAVTLPFILFLFPDFLKLDKKAWIILFSCTFLILGMSLYLEYERGIRTTIPLIKRLANFSFIGFDLIFRSIAMKPFPPWDSRLMGNEIVTIKDYFLLSLIPIVAILTYRLKVKFNFRFFSLWIAYLFLLFPVSGFSSNLPMSLDRYSYLAVIPLLFMIPTKINLNNNFATRLVFVFCLIILCNNIVINLTQQITWKNNRLFFENLINFHHDNQELRNGFKRRLIDADYYEKMGANEYQKLFIEKLK